MPVNKIKFSIKLLIATVICLSIPSQASANAGVPMIYLSFPVMLVALIPIILLEGYIYNSRLNVNLRKALIGSGIANILSTVAGFPLAWGLLLGLELLTTGGSCGPGFNSFPDSIITAIVESAWLCPWEEHLYWLIPIAFINSLIVAFFISIIMELFVTRKVFKTIEISKIKSATFRANLSSYFLLIFLGIGYLIYSIGVYK